MWRHTNGDVAIWFLSGTSILSTASIASISNTSAILGSDDLNGDGKIDITGRNANGVVGSGL